MTDPEFKCNILFILIVTVFIARLSMYYIVNKCNLLSILMMTSLWLKLVNVERLYDSRYRR